VHLPKSKYIPVGRCVLKPFLCQMPITFLSVSLAFLLLSMYITFVYFCSHRTSLALISNLADLQILGKHPFWQAQAPADHEIKHDKEQIKSEVYNRFWAKPIPDIQYQLLQLTMCQGGVALKHN